MTTSELTPEARLTILKHLANGKALEVVAAITRLTREQVLDVASRHGYPDTEALTWAADILKKKIEDNRKAELPKPTPVPSSATPIRPAAGGIPPTPAAGAPVVSEAHSVIDRGKQHPSKRIQAAANRVLDDLDRLRTMLRDDEAKHAEKRKADAAKAAARAEVDRLEAQLAEAKAKLRGGAKAKKRAATAKPERVQGPLDFECRNEGCDKAYDTPQGRSLHERMRCEHRAEAAS